MGSAWVEEILSGLKYFFLKELFWKVGGKMLFSMKKLKELFQRVIIIMAVINSVIDFSNLGEQIITEVVLKSLNYFKYVAVKKILTPK